MQLFGYKETNLLTLNIFDYTRIFNLSNTILLNDNVVVELSEEFKKMIEDECYKLVNYEDYLNCACKDCLAFIPIKNINKTTKIYCFSYSFPWNNDQIEWLCNIINNQQTKELNDKLFYFELEPIEIFNISALLLPLNNIK